MTEGFPLGNTAIQIPEYAPRYDADIENLAEQLKLQFGIELPELESVRKFLFSPENAQFLEYATSLITEKHEFDSVQAEKITNLISSAVEYSLEQENRTLQLATQIDTVLTGDAEIQNLEQSL